MKKLMLSQATEIAKAYLGLSIEMVTDRDSVSDRYQIWAIKCISLKCHRQFQWSHGHSWLECIAKLLPEIHHKEFDEKPGDWTNWIAEIRQLRRNKETLARNSV